jgi:hypothetical protein
MATQASVSPTEQDHAKHIADNYLQNVKGWDKTVYHLEFLHQEGTSGSPVIVLDAIHNADLGKRERRASQSLQLHVDLQDRRVIRELGYQ